MAKKAYIGVDGVARKIKKGCIGVDGVARTIKYGCIGVNGVARQTVVDATSVFANSTWEQIVQACQTNSVPSTWRVGDQKPMTINGVDYNIDIIGKNHDVYSDGSGTAPLTFQLNDCYGAVYRMNSEATNVGGWTDCAVRKIHLPAILSLMPSEVKAGIKEVHKKTSAGNNDTTINTTADKLFLLSEIEVFGEISSSIAGEGSQYAYYSEGNSTVKTGTNGWSLRSPSRYGNAGFCYVHYTGSAAGGSASLSRSLAFAFCF